ncbi:RrF2 family transcriptional regulator [Anaerosporobacter sp.]
MKISTKGRYALRLMLDLALNDTGETIRIKDIAARQEISEKYLEQIIAVLNKAGYVKSVRGPQGGYRLARKPKEYTVGMILRLTEGSLAPVACLDDDPNECSRQEDCVTIYIWEKLYEAINSVVDKYTLADLVEWELAKADHYVI